MNTTFSPTTPGAFLLRANDVARILNISKALAYRLMEEGKIPTVRINRSVRVRPEDLEQYIQTKLPS